MRNYCVPFSIIQCIPGYYYIILLRDGIKVPSSSFLVTPLFVTSMILYLHTYVDWSSVGPL